MLLVVIAACEILFWVFLLGGLVLRYVFRARTASTISLILVPVADLILIVATVIDLARGATADWTHTLAASYLGFSVGFGHSIVKSMDQRFAYRFDGGPKPVKPPKYGREKTRYEWQLFGKAATAIGIALGLLVVAILVIDDPARTMAFKPQIISLCTILLLWFGWPVSYTFWPAKPKAHKGEQPTEHAAR
jgi:hypothetical protein